MNKVQLLTSSLLTIVVAVSAQAGKVEELVAAGNAAFKTEQYSEAMEQYQLAETELPESPELDYNIAGVLHHQEKFEEAIERYNRSLNSEEASLHADAYYNLGNTYYRMGDYQNSIVNFQKALEANPDDMSAKFNLELARKMLKENMKPESKEPDPEQQQQEQQEQDQQQQEKQDNQEQPQAEPEENQDQNQEPQPQPQDSDEISKEDAERILNALKDDEAEQQKKVQRKVHGGDYNGNDW